jgi:hypothetical protein
MMRHAYEMRARKVHAYETHTHQMHARQRQAHEVHAHGMHELGRCREILDLSPSLVCLAVSVDALGAIFGAKSGAKGATYGGRLGPYVTVPLCPHRKSPKPQNYSRKSKFPYTSYIFTGKLHLCDAQ